MAARSSLLSKLLLCNRCFRRSQPLLATKRFTSNNNNGPVTNARSLHANLWEEYRKRKSVIEAQPLPQDRDPTAIYANNELDLQEIEVYGFDYDYTLASYTPALHYLIYNLGREVLVTDHKYPKNILKIDYDPNFSIRGLHCDVRKGLLLKIDAFHNIQLGAVYKGLQRLSDDEVTDIYNGTHVAIDNMSSFYGKVNIKSEKVYTKSEKINAKEYANVGPNMFQLMDLFAVPEMTLFSNVIEYFVQNNIAYDPEYVFYDIKTAVQGLHSSGKLHSEIMRNIAVFLAKDSSVHYLLRRLSKAGKKLFLITNSGVSFVDAGMTYLVGPDWLDLFDVVITNARKPKFFYDTNRPFRSYDYELDIKSWDKVSQLKKGMFYQEGNLYQFRELTGWYGSKVLYFGDHVYSDLADAALKHGWRTGAIIPEIENEVRIINSDLYKKSVSWLVALENLITEVQKNEHPEAQAVVQHWLKERSDLRIVAKKIFNPQFGSVFRTYHNATYFSRRLNRFADVYMSSVENLLHYPLNYTFYPRRTALPHEVEFITPCDDVPTS